MTEPTPEDRRDAEEQIRSEFFPQCTGKRWVATRDYTIVHALIIERSKTLALERRTVEGDKMRMP